MTLAIFGPGGFGRELVAIATDICFVSDDPAQVGTSIFDVEVIDLSELVRRAQHTDMSAVVAVANGAQRRAIFDRLEAEGIRHGHAQAASAIVGAGVTIGPGAILCANTMVTASVSIGKGFHSNYYSYVAHDCTIGDFVTLAPRVGINGNVVIEDDAYIGAGAILRQGKPGKPLRIGAGAVVGMGAVVTKDVAPGTTVIGNPARLLVRS